jgi:hypothetical protein
LNACTPPAAPSSAGAIGERRGSRARLRRYFLRLRWVRPYTSAIVFVIYALHHPQTGEIRYVGQTGSPLYDRMARHRHEAKSGNRTHLYCWWRSLAGEPVVEVLEVIPTALGDEAIMADAAEIRWIVYGHAQGWRLTNNTAGSEGTHGHKHTTETRAKISTSGRGLKRSPETRAKISAAACNPSPETRAKMSAAHQGHEVTPETRARIGAAHRGQTVSLESRAKNSATHRAIWARRKSLQES